MGLTRAIASEVGRHGIRANVVAPGFIETDMTAALPAKARERNVAQIPMGRMGSADEVAAAIVWLLGDSCPYATGTTLRVAGGR